MQTMFNTPAAGGGADLIKDSSDRAFMADVIEASRRQPVIVDFWAPWCGPCKQLTPLLEKVGRQANGKVKLVKINVDENQQIAAQMRIQSIPAVFAFVDGQPVDGFMGALPEGQIKQFIDRLGSQGSVAEELEQGVAEGRTALAAKDYATAAQIFAQVLQADREHAGAISGLAKTQIETGDLARAKATLALVPAGRAPASPWLWRGRRSRSGSWPTRRWRPHVRGRPAVPGRRSGRRWHSPWRQAPCGLQRTS